MVTITVDISSRDENDVITIAKKIATTGGLSQALHVRELLAWIWGKKKHGLTVHRPDPHSWHITVPK